MLYKCPEQEIISYWNCWLFQLVDCYDAVNWLSVPVGCLLWNLSCVAVSVGWLLWNLKWLSVPAVWLFQLVDCYDNWVVCLFQLVDCYDNWVVYLFQLVDCYDIRVGCLFQLVDCCDFLSCLSVSVCWMFGDWYDFLSFSVFFLNWIDFGGS